MINKNVEKAIINQIKLEEHSSVFTGHGFMVRSPRIPGRSFWLYKQTDEERFLRLNSSSM